jgi:hypothetical protein
VAYLDGGGHEELLRAAGKVIDCDLPFAAQHAHTMSELTGDRDIVIETYGDAAHAIMRWFFQMRAWSEALRGSVDDRAPHGD